MLNEVLWKRLETLCAKTPGAFAFILMFGALCHGIDDLIDKDNPEIKDEKAHILDLAQLSMDVYSSPFYHNNLWLYPACSNIHRVYADSVAWEKHSEGWRREYADKLRCCGNEIILVVLKHCCGVSNAELRELSLLVREDSWNRHHDEKGNPT